MPLPVAGAARAHGFNPAKLRHLRGLTFEHVTLFLERWNEYFGR